MFFSRYWPCRIKFNFFSFKLSKIVATPFVRIFLIFCCISKQKVLYFTTRRKFPFCLCWKTIAFTCSIFYLLYNGFNIIVLVNNSLSIINFTVPQFFYINVKCFNNFSTQRFNTHIKRGDTYFMYRFTIHSKTMFTIKSHIHFPASH